MTGLPALTNLRGDLTRRAKGAADRLGATLRARLSLYGDPGLPEQIHLCPTDRCNLKCRQCDIWRIKPAPELTTAEWEAILDSIGEFAGAVSLNLAGGEPFLRPDLLHLIRYAADLGFTVTANSNGTLIDAAMAKAIFESGLSTLYISLDGFSPHSHDFIRNKPDLFDKLMSNLDLMDAYPSPQVIFSTILHRRSVSEIEMGLAMVKARGYQLVVQPLYQTFGEPYDGDWYRRSSLFPDDIIQVDAALDRLIEEKAKDGPVCNAIPQLQAMKGYYRAPTLPNGQSCKAGFKDISLDPYGNFHLCYHLKPIGNIRDSSVEDLWISQDAAILRQEVASCPRTCNLLNCNFEREG